MKCQCLSDLSKNAVEQIKVWKKKKIISASVKETTMHFGPPVDLLTYSNLSMILENTKRPVDVILVHAYCPFCGKKTGVKKDSLVKL